MSEDHGSVLDIVRSPTKSAANDCLTCIRTTAVGGPAASGFVKYHQPITDYPPAVSCHLQAQQRRAVSGRPGDCDPDAKPANNTSGQYAKTAGGVKLRAGPKSEPGPCCILGTLVRRQDLDACLTDPDGPELGQP